MTHTLLLWIGFGLFVLTMLVIDLGVFHRKAHTVSVREAAVWTAIWVSLALVFNGAIYFGRGIDPAIEFLTGYIIEWSLSMDNVFVFAVIFTYFAVPAQFQHRVLFWGILGAVITRLVFIVAGAALLERFHGLIYVMGFFLVFTGVKLLFERGRESDVGRNPVLRLARSWLPITREFVGPKFFVRHGEPVDETVTTGQDQADARHSIVRATPRWFVTPLFLVLLVVETTDVAFAADSIPAIFAVTRDPFIVFTSNVFAILGLRSLYFLLARAIDKFRYLSTGLAAVLCFVGIKMLISAWYDIPIALSLGVVVNIIALAIIASLWRSPRDPRSASRSALNSLSSAKSQQVHIPTYQGRP